MGKLEVEPTLPEGMLSDGPDWTFSLLSQYEDEIDRVAKIYKLDTYPNQIEIITAEQMMDAYASIGMPINYSHWSFGKKFISTEQGYRRGQMGLAYEIVINSEPCISYLMEEHWLLPMLVMGTTRFLKVIIYSRLGLTQAQSLIIWCLPKNSYPIVKKNMGSMKSKKSWIHVTH